MRIFMFGYGHCRNVIMFYDCSITTTCGVHMDPNNTGETTIAT